MKLIAYKGEQPNFGDELNHWMWPQLLPGFFDENEDTVFLGIGSIIGERAFSSAQQKIVFGAGFVPEYHAQPDMAGRDWKIYFVRGLRTAQLLGLGPELALGDPAILLRNLLACKARPREVVSFMPHWQSLERGNWEEACRRACINLIDPRRPVEEVIGELLRSRLVLAEAMHGAIVADCLRIPWVALLPLNKVHRAKWHDWAAALGLKPGFCRLVPSSLQELRLSFLRGLVMALPGQKLIGRALVKLSAWRLRCLAKSAGSLSTDEAIERVTAAMQQKLEELRRDYRDVGGSL